MADLLSRYPRWKWCVIAAICFVIMVGCTDQPLPQLTDSTVPYSDDWLTSTPEEQGMDSALLAEMLETIAQQSYGIDAVVVVRNGIKVLDANIYPFERGEQHVLYSCTKSVISALIGIAIEQGYIEGVDQPVLEIFPDYKFSNLDADKEAMTIEDLLMMSSGLDCRDSYLYNWEGLDAMWESDDWVQYVLDLPMVAPPGEKFEYCNGVSSLLSAIIQKTTGMTAYEFANANLFSYLGITDVMWETNPQGTSLGYKGLHMLPQDMAKFGFLYLQQGRWDNQQIIPAEWVEASTHKYINGTLQPGYGYQWWVPNYNAYMALGYQGQYIVIMPALDLVAVFVSDLSDEQFYVPEDLLRTYIIPAAESTKPLPENPNGVRALQTQIKALAEP